MKDYTCTHPFQKTKGMCGKEPYGLVAYIPRFQLVSSNQVAALKVALNRKLGKNRDIGEFATENTIITPQIHISCQEYVNKTNSAINLSQGVNEEFANLYFYMAELNDERKAVIRSMGKNKDKFMKGIRSKLDNLIDEWIFEINYPSGFNFNYEVNQAVDILDNQKRYNLVLKGFADQYDALLNHLKNGTELEHTFQLENAPKLIK